MPPRGKLVSVATAVPPFCFEQRDASAHRGFAARFADFARLAKVFENSGIQRRYGVRPIGWYFEPLGWPERTKAYLGGGVTLYIEAASKALDLAGIGVGEADAAACIVRSGGTGIAAIEMIGQYIWPDTLDVAGWTVEPSGFGVIFDRAIPAFAEANMAPAVAGILGRAGPRVSGIDRFTSHRGTGIPRSRRQGPQSRQKQQRRAGNEANQHRIRRRRRGRQAQRPGRLDASRARPRRPVQGWWSIRDHHSHP